MAKKKDKKEKVGIASVEIRDHPTSPEHQIGIVTDANQCDWFVSFTREAQITEKVIRLAWKDERHTFEPYSGA